MPLSSYDRTSTGHLEIDQDPVVDFDTALNEALIEPKKRRKVPSWMSVIGLAALLDLGARFFVPASMPFVLKFEAVIFAAAAIGLLIPTLKRPSLVGYRKKLHRWLSGAFALGAIRAGMWGFGVPVEYANLTSFVLGVCALGFLYFWKNKHSKD